MTTKQYLKQIERLDLMIENKLSEVYNLKAMAVSISSPSNTDRVQSSGSYDKLSDKVAKLVDMEREIDELVDNYVDTRKKIISQIDAMENKNSYSILTDVYVKRIPFKEIFIRMKISERRMYSLYSIAMKEFEQLYGAEYLQK